MHARSLAAAIATALSTLVAPLASPAAEPAVWPQWRGPRATGEAPAGNPPLAWSETENVRFKVAIPGKGLSTPIVWGNRIFLTSAVPKAPEPPPAPPADGERMPRVAPSAAQRFLVLALDLATGKTLWEHSPREAVPHEGTHLDASWASASPVTDGEHLFAHFGSNGLYAYDLEGNLKWSKDLGDMATRNAFGEGSSPALHGDTLVVNWDHEGESFVVALDKRTGEERWRRPREGEVTSWSTPLVVEVGGKAQVVIASTGKTRAYDLPTGNVVWEAQGMTLNVIPSPVAANGMVYLMSGFRGNALQAIRLEAAQGMVASAPALVWSHDRDTPYVPSPLLHDGLLYFVKHNQAMLSALDSQTGAVAYGPARLEGLEGIYASPVAAAGRLYVAGRNGTTAVLKAGRELQVLALNRLDDRFDASPVVAGDALLLRGHQHLYRLETMPKPAAR